MTYLINSKISGFSRSLCFILSFIAVIIEFALSSAPCLLLFSAAPRIKVKQNNIVIAIYTLRYLKAYFVSSLHSRGLYTSRDILRHIQCIGPLGGQCPIADLHIRSSMSVMLLSIGQNYVASWTILDR